MAKTDSTTLESIWLAGLGALAAAEEDGAKLFKGLVKRGHQYAVSHTDLKQALEGGRIQIEELPRIEKLPWELLKAFETSERVTVPTPSTAETTHLRRNAEARAAFLEEFGTLTSREVAEFAGSSAANRAALANRWKTEGRIFALETGGQTRFPAFQFSADDGQPRPVIAEILKLLQPRLSGWQTALWFTGRNGWLGGERPVDLLTATPAAVVEAARQEAEAFD